MLRVRNVLHVTIILMVVLAVTLVACDVEPPTIVRTPKSSLVGEYGDLPLLEGSPTAQRMWERGFVKYGPALAVPYASIRKGQRNDFIGIIPDLAEVIGRQLGLPCVERLQRWTQMPAHLESGEVLMIIGGPASRPEFDGLEFVQVGERGYCLVARADDDRFHEVEDILKPGVAVAAVQGTDGEHYLLTNYTDVEVSSKPVVAAEKIILDVLAGEADVTMVYSLATPLFLENYPELKTFPAECVEDPIWSVPWGISILPGDPVFRQFLEALVAKMKETGWFEERTERWLDSELLEDALTLEE